MWLGTSGGGGGGPRCWGVVNRCCVVADTVESAAPSIHRDSSNGLSELVWAEYCTRMANSALRCQIIILITARSLCSYNNILINFGQLYSNSCYTTFSIATLGMCIACEFHQLWAVRPCIYHIFQHLTKWLIFCRTRHACMVGMWVWVVGVTSTYFNLLESRIYLVFVLRSIHNRRCSNIGVQLRQLT